MNICFISFCDLSVENGGRTHTVELVRWWLDAGHNVFLFSTGLLDKRGLEGMRYVNLPRVSLRGLNGISLAFFASILLPLYHLLYGFDVIYERKMLFTSSILPARLLGIPVVMELNDIPYSMDIDSMIPRERNIVKRFQLKIVRPVIFSDAFLTSHLSSRIILTAKIDLPSVDKSKVTQIPFGSNTSLFAPMDKAECRTNLGYPPKAKIVLFVGTFLPWQGVEYIIRAMPQVIRQIPDAMLVLVGDAEQKMPDSVKLKEGLLSAIRDLGLGERVILRGRVPYSEIPEHINAGDVCVVAQRPFRSGYTPLKIFEYMSCGKPVVASDISGVREIVDESGGGMLFEPENPERLAMAIIGLLDNEPLAVGMGERGRQCVLKKYSWENVARTALKVCEAAVR
jgi:glycosyltransferase involved in cell wall biosynthesis